jgi:hypothetical protein
VVLGTTRLEQFGHPRQTAGDVLGLGTLARDPRHHVAGLDRLAVFDREDRVHRHRVGDRVALIVAHGSPSSPTMMISGLSSLPLGAVRQSDTIFWVMPVASSVSSRTDTPEVRSTNFAVPAFSAMIGSV